MHKHFGHEFMGYFSIYGESDELPLSLSGRKEKEFDQLVMVVRVPIDIAYISAHSNIWRI